MKVPTIAVVGMIIAAGPALAHHPFASEFDAGAPVRLTGKVTQVNWGNPHVKIRIPPVPRPEIRTGRLKPPVPLT